MDNVPFNILLGRPFFQAGLCRTIDFANGEQHITIMDPATRHEVTIPTHTRGREGSRERGREEAEINGFLWEEEHSEGVDGYVLDMGRELEEGECEACRVEMKVEEEGEQGDQSGEWMKYKKVRTRRSLWRRHYQKNFA